MTYDEAETFLILKYGDMPTAYRAWVVENQSNPYGMFSATEIEVFHEYERAMHRESGLGINDPR